MLLTKKSRLTTFITTPSKEYLLQNYFIIRKQEIYYISYTLHNTKPSHVSSKHAQLNGRYNHTRSHKIENAPDGTQVT